MQNSGALLQKFPGSERRANELALDNQQNFFAWISHMNTILDKVVPFINKSDDNLKLFVPYYNPLG